MSDKPNIDERSRKILADAQKRKLPILISGDGLDVTSQSKVLEISDSHLLIANKIPPPLISDFMGSKNFSLMVNMIRFQSKRVESDGQHIIFPLAEDSLIEETRQAERFSFAADEQVVCEFTNPYDGETVLNKPVLDMSATGLSIRSHFRSSLFEKNMSLGKLRVLIDGKPYTQGEGEVVYRRKMLDISGKLRLQVGIKLNTPNAGRS